MKSCPIRIPDNEEGRDAVVADGGESDAEGPDFSGQKEEVVHKRFG